MKTVVPCVDFIEQRILLSSVLTLIASLESAASLVVQSAEGGRRHS